MAFSKNTLTKRREELISTAGVSQTDQRVAKVENAVGRISSAEQAVEEITHLWIEAQDKFIAIGRYLIRTKDKFPKSFEKEVIAKLPFGYNVAHQLMSVARAIDNGVLKQDELPKTYSVAYHLTTLSNSQLSEARQSGLINPDLSRRAIVSFKKALEHRKMQALGKRALIERERDELRRKLGKLQQQTQELARQLAEVEASLEEVAPSHD
jgi:prefoldin subunit 5